MRISLCTVVVMVAIASPVARAGDLGTPIDLSSFSGMASVLDESTTTSDADGMPIVPVDSSGDATWIRPYVTGISGASFGTLNAGGSGNVLGQAIQTAGSVNETMFTGGGAVGMALPRPSGLLRMEIEGRARGPMRGQTRLVAGEGGGEAGVVPLSTTASGGWSAMTNFWRDWFVTDRVGAYAGGGFGVGGYQYSTSLDAGDIGGNVGGSSIVNTFAWQTGAGFTYQLSDRVTFDTGYRFFSMSPGATPLSAGVFPGVVLPAGSFTSAFSASELLLSLRIYEPFRDWR